MVIASTETQCPACGTHSFAVFVQWGSFFFECTACGEPGPATSWIGVRDELDEPVRAVVVNNNHEEIEVLGHGTGTELLERITEAAHRGKRIRLTSR